MKKSYVLMTNISNKDFNGKWDGRDFCIKEGESKLLPKFLADKFSEIIATDIFHQLKKDLIGKEEMAELKAKMVGNEIIEVEMPAKTEVDLMVEEIEYANNKYLNK